MRARESYGGEPSSQQMRGHPLLEVGVIERPRVGPDDGKATGRGLDDLEIDSILVRPLRDAELSFVGGVRHAAIARVDPSNAGALENIFESMHG